MRAIVSLKLNNEAVKAKINKALAASPIIKRLAFQKADKLFLRYKALMLKEFDQHPVTQEILWGPRALNISGTLDGYGNLFSFIGFYQGDRPTDTLRMLLDLGTQFHQTIYRNKTWYFRVRLPTKQAIEEVTQMPWERGNSWAFAVEHQISGLSHYMYKSWVGANSRSGMGIQLPYDYLEDAIFTGKPYITKILENFRSRIGKE
jgi:hypothetical protein